MADHVDVREVLRQRHMRELSEYAHEAGQRPHIVQRLDELMQQMARDGIRLEPDERAKLAEQVADDICGYGPLQPLLDDATVTEVMVNGPDRIFVERDGRKGLHDVTFDSDRHLRTTVEKMLRFGTKRLDEQSPYVDLAMPDGTRANVIIPPVVEGGPHVTLRKYIRTINSLDDLLARGAVDERMASFLVGCVRAHMNILFSGATGCGKTTLLEVLGGQFGADERIVVIEDTPELRFGQTNVVRMLTRAPNVEGKGEITTRELFVNSLRMRPSRIILGEIRGKEALDYLQAVTSGHRGSLAVIHASSPEEAAIRMENLVLQSGVNIPVSAIRQQIVHGIDVIVQQVQLSDGTRRVNRIAEILDLDDAGNIEMRDVFQFEEEALEEDGTVRGRFTPTGVVPEFFPRFALAGAPVDEAIFKV